MYLELRGLSGENGKISLNFLRYLRLDMQMNVYHDFFAVKREFFNSFGNGRDINV